MLFIASHVALTELPGGMNTLTVTGDSKGDLLWLGSDSEVIQLYIELPCYFE